MRGVPGTFENISERTFARLTVIGSSPVGKQKLWKCRCSCGNIVSIKIASLKNGVTKSCGCIRRYDLIGKVFDGWTVESFDKMRKRGSYWNCICKCGIRKTVQGLMLVHGRSKSCGCLTMSAAKIRPYEALYKSLAKSAKERAIECSISYEQFLLFTEIKECHYCLESISWAKHGLKKNGAKYQLDRKDNSMCYAFENCVVCCTKCNRAKSARYSYEEWHGMTQWLRTRKGIQ